MVDSKNKKSSSGAVTEKATAVKKVEKKPANKTAKTSSKASATSAPSTSSKATTSKANSDSVIAKDKNTNKANAKPSSSAKTATSNKTASKEPAKPATVKKEKRAGGGMAFLALLCSLGALGLSGYMFYEQKFAPQVKQSQDALLSGVNEIKSNVSEFGTVVSSLQKEVIDFKANQEQYITKDTLISTVKDSVDDAVGNLPDLPDIGPKGAETGASIGKLDTVGNALDSQSESLTANTSKEAVSTKSTIDSVLPDLSGQSSGVVTGADSVESTADSTQVNTASGESVESDEGAWSWNRAKQDIKDMFKSFVKVEKIDQK